MDLTDCRLTGDFTVLGSMNGQCTIVHHGQIIIFHEDHLVGMFDNRTKMNTNQYRSDEQRWKETDLASEAK